MRAIWLVVLVGCAADPSAPAPTLPTPPAPIPQPTAMPAPGTCTDVTLTPANSGRPATQTLPLTIDTQGIALCLHLDASALARAHFMAGTPSQPGTSSSFESALADAGGHVIVAGWDVTVGGTDPTSFSNLEWSPPAGQVTDAKLIVWTRAGSSPTSVSVSLFDPLE
jgi:hypothetical protein